MSGDKRLTDLEMLAAEQERTIEELSNQIAEQWRLIEAMRLRLDRLSDRRLAFEEHGGPDVPATKPPHW